MLKQAYREHIELRVNLRRQNDQGALQEKAKYEKLIHIEWICGLRLDTLPALDPLE